MGKIFIEENQSYFQEKLFQNYFYNYLKNPFFIVNQIFPVLFSYSYFDFETIFPLINYTENLIVQISNEANHQFQLQKEKEEIEKEKKVLDLKYRKSLDEEKQLKLRNILHELSLIELKSDFQRSNSTKLDKLNKKFIEFIFPENTKKNFIQHNFTQESKEKILELILPNIKSLKIHIKLIQHFKKLLEYPLVIYCSLEVQNRIELLETTIKERKTLDKKIEYLENNVFNDLSLEPQLEEMTQFRNNLPPLEYEEDTLKKFLIESSELCSAASSIENKPDIILQQALIAFRADPSEIRWDRVRSVSTEDEWKIIKEDLVSFILLDQNKNVNEKIELLMKDGLWSHCLDIYPSPTQADGEIEQLIQVWTGITKYNPSLLPTKMLHIVSKYIKFYFQVFKFSDVYQLLDLVQRRFPDFLANVYGQALDMILITILPSQYASLVIALKDLKTRLTAMARVEDWQKFLQDFMVKHKSKKKLMQMVNRITDSSYNLENLLEMENLKKRKGRPSSDIKSEDGRTSRSPVGVRKKEAKEEKEEDEEPPKKRMKTSPKKSIASTKSASPKSARKPTPKKKIFANAMLSSESEDSEDLPNRKVRKISIDSDSTPEILEDD